MPIKRYTDFESDKKVKTIKEDVLISPKMDIEILEEKIIKFNTGKVKDILETIKNKYPETDYFIREDNNQLHVVKYNQNLKLNINEFVNSLLHFYAKNAKLKTLIEGIKVKGNANFSIIENMNPKKSFKFVEDLTKLLSMKNT